MSFEIHRPDIHGAFHGLRAHRPYLQPPGEARLSMTLDVIAGLRIRHELLQRIDGAGLVAFLQIGVGSGS